MKLMLKLLRYLKKREWADIGLAFIFIILQVYLDLKMPDYMDTNVLKYQAFVKSAETKSFTKAAESLHYTQGGISRMIADLENEWQVSLFSRGKKGLELTEDGKRLLPYAEGLCASFERLEGEVSDLRGLGKGTIRIGVFSSVATYWLPSIIAAFQKEHPGISYQLKLGDYEEIEGWVNDGEVDCGFLSIPCKTPLDCLSLAKDEAVVVLPENHPLCAKERISLQDLSPYPFLMRSGISSNSAQWFEASEKMLAPPLASMAFVFRSSRMAKCSVKKALISDSSLSELFQYDAPSYS